MSKNNEQLLAAFTKTLGSFKKANKEARQRMAERAGHATADAFLAHLEREIAKLGTAPKAAKTPKAKNVKPVIHIVNILDASSSMEGSKFDNALKGINSEFKELRESKDITYLGTFVSFSYRNQINTLVSKKSVHQIQHLAPRADGMTALYDAIGRTLTQVKKEHVAGEKVLVNIFTDGQENNSTTWNAGTTQELIKECEALGFTVTFVGTPTDVADVVKRLSIKASNTLTHNNTGAGVEASFKTRSAATKTYSAKVLRGEDVSVGFYKSNETL